MSRTESALQVVPSRIEGRIGRTMRLVPVEGDTMIPTLFPGDAVGALPVDAFSYDGIYVLDVFGTPTVFRCRCDHRGGIDLVSDNAVYPVHKVSRAAFAESVIGQVAVLCQVVDGTLLKV